MSQENSSNDMMSDAYPDQTNPSRQQQKQSWDRNGDGILQKSEADRWFLSEGNGKPITVDGNKINLDGLKAEHMTYNAKTKTYSLSTTKAFDVLPWETAVTYGGSTFKLVDGKWQMLSQDYHYDLRPWNSKENIFRNLANELGKPRAFFSTSEKYLINIKY